MFFFCFLVLILFYLDSKNNGFFEITTFFIILTFVLLLISILLFICIVIVLKYQDKEHRSPDTIYNETVSFNDLIKSNELIANGQFSTIYKVI